MKTTLLAGAVALSLFSTAAFADDCDHAATAVPGAVYSNADYRYGGYDRRDDDRDDRDGRGFARSHRGHGSYQQVTRQVWVAGATTQVFVPGECHRIPFSPVQACTPGHYVTQQLPGHYETVQEWVWVPRHDEGHRFGREAYGYGYGRR